MAPSCSPALSGADREAHAASAHLELGVERIDRQHADLMAQVEALETSEAPVSALISALAAAVRSHFADEERWFESLGLEGHPELASHLEAHRRFLIELDELDRTPGAHDRSNVAGYLRAALSVHVLADQLLAENALGLSAREHVIESVHAAVTSMWADVTRARRALEAQRRDASATAERYRMLVESTSAVPFELDAETLRYTYLSPQAPRLLGLSRELAAVDPAGADWASVQAELADLSAMMATMPFVDLVHPSDRPGVLRRLTAFAQSRDTDELELEYRVVGADGSELYVRSTMVHDHKAPRLVRGVSLNVTAQKLAEAELRQSQKLESVGRLAAGVAHEINTPVQYVSDSVSFLEGAVVGLKDVVEAARALWTAAEAAGVAGPERERLAEAWEAADLDFTIEELPRAVARSADGAGRVAAIVRSLKDFAYPDQREKSYVDLNRAIESTLTITRNEYKYVAELETDFAAGLPPILCHAGEVNQCVLNLVVNAAHAIEDVVRGTDQRGVIRVGTRLVGPNVEVTVSDTGGGIPRSVQPRIFDPFFTTKDVGRGTGQGLAIVRSAMERHGGRVTFETGRHGTTFTLTLPVDGAASQDPCPAP